MKSFYKLLIIVVLGALVYLLLTGKVESCQQKTIKSDTTIVHDTAWNEKIIKYPVYTPGPVTTLPGDTQWLTQPIDTMKLLRDYYAKRVYNDTIWIDSFGYVYWFDTITKNKIDKRQKGKNYRIPTITKTVTINNYYQQSRELNVSTHIDPLKGMIYGGLTYEDRKNKMYHVSGGLGLRGYGVMVGITIPIYKESPLFKK